MIGLIQRVRRASVAVKDKEIAVIAHGLLVFIGIEKHDGWTHAVRLAKKLLAYRVFEDDDKKMNQTVKDVEGSILLVPQFTLAANTCKGNRPDFGNAMPTEQAQALFTQFCAYMQECYPQVTCGEFGADMQVELINDGPVTFWLSC